MRNVDGNSAGLFAPITDNSRGAMGIEAVAVAVEAPFGIELGSEFSVGNRDCDSRGGGEAFGGSQTIIDFLRPIV